MIPEVCDTCAFGDGGLLVLLIAALAVFCAAIVQNTVGMGFGQVAAPILLILDPRFVPAAVLLMGTAAALIGAIRGRRDVARGELGMALAGRALGALLAGQLMVAFADPDAFAVLFAVLVLLAVALSARNWRVRLDRGTLLVAGTLSGLMGTVTSIGAPPMGIVYQHSPAPKVRATLNVYFSAGAALSVAALALHGLVGTRDLLLALWLMPPLFAGAWVSRFLTGFVDRRFRRFVLWICATSAVVILARVAL